MVVGAAPRIGEIKVGLWKTWILSGSGELFGLAVLRLGVEVWMLSKQHRVFFHSALNSLVEVI